MTTEVAVPISPAFGIRPSVDLAAFVEEASAVHRIAQALSTTSFVPKPYQGRPDEITAAILMGRELDIPPMAALQMFNLIQGRPTLSANAMRGLAMSHGVEFRIDEQTDTRVVMSARPPGVEKWTTVTWTIERAKRMGLTEKENWKKMPQDMLTARCTSQLCRLVAANVLIGLPYSSEEMQDAKGGTMWVDLGTSTPEAPQTRTIRRKAPVYEAPEEPELVEETGPTPISTETRKILMAACNDLNIRSRDDRLAYISEILGRSVQSTNDLTDDEGLEVIRVLNQARNAAADWPPVTEQVSA